MSPLLVLLTLVCLGVYAILAAVVWIGLILRVGGKHASPVAPAWPHHGPHRDSLRPLGSFAIWEWRDGRWRLLPDNLPAGVDPGLPPAYAGAHDGEVVKTSIRTPRE